MTEHLNADEFSTGTTDILLHNLPIDFCHLIHIQFTGKNHHIGKLRIEPQRFYITDIELCTQMHLKTNLTAVLHHSHITGNYGRYTGFQCRIQNLAHHGQVLAIDNRIDGKITLDTTMAAFAGNVLEVIYGESAGGMGTHIQMLNTKIYAVRTGTQGC